MKKVVIPTILAATILVAGMFAMMPVQKASTIHSSISSGPLALTATIQPATAAADQATWTIGAPFCVLGAARTGGVDANANLDGGVFGLSTNLATAAEVGLAVNDALGAASIAARDLILSEGVNVLENPVCGTTTVSLINTAAAGDAAIDTNNVTVIIQTRGSIAAPAAVLS